MRGRSAEFQTAMARGFSPGPQAPVMQKVQQPVPYTTPFSNSQSSGANFNQTILPLGQGVAIGGASSPPMPGAMASAEGLQSRLDRRHSTMTANLIEQAQMGKAAEAQHACQHVRALTGEVGETIANLQADNIRLKRRLLHERRATLEQFFMADDHLLKQSIMGAWWRLVEESRRRRQLEGVELEMIGDRNAYDARLAELEAQAGVARARRAEIDQDKEILRRRLEQAEALIGAIANSVVGYPLPPPREVLKHEAGRYCQARIAGLLRDLDPGYAEYTPPALPWEIDPFEQTLRTQFLEADVNGDGILEWNNGEIRYFICRALQAAGNPAPPWDDRTWYTMYRQFDRDGTCRMDYRDCAALARAIREAAHPSTALGIAWTSPSHQVVNGRS